MALKPHASNKRILAEESKMSEAHSSIDHITKRARTNTSGTPDRTINRRCHLLKLAPELRNLIYDFAEEDLSTSRYAPGVQRMHRPVAHAEWAQRQWKLYALTQTCQLLRTEFYPLWMRKLAVRLNPGTVTDFIATFLPTTAQHTVGPNLTQLLWSHPDDMHSPDLTNITPLIQVHARLPSLNLEYVPVQAAELKTVTNEGPCKNCSEGMNAEEDGGNLEDFEGDCICNEQAMDYDEWAATEEQDMAYTKILQDFLSTNNKEWLQDINAGRISVNCTFHRLAELLRFRIRYKEASETSTHGYDAACGLLERLGIFGLPREAEMEFVVAFEMAEARTGESVSTKPECWAETACEDCSNRC